LRDGNRIVITVGGARLRVDVIIVGDARIISAFVSRVETKSLFFLQRILDILVRRGLEKIVAAVRGSSPPFHRRPRRLMIYRKGGDRLEDGVLVESILVVDDDRVSLPMLLLATLKMYVRMKLLFLTLARLMKMKRTRVRIGVGGRRVGVRRIVYEESRRGIWADARMERRVVIYGYQDGRRVDESGRMENTWKGAWTIFVAVFVLQRISARRRRRGRVFFVQRGKRRRSQIIGLEVSDYAIGGDGVFAIQQSVVGRQ
jgi:hypothetical protein